MAQDAEYHRQWRATHPGSNNAASRKWRESNREKSREASRRWGGRKRGLPEPTRPCPLTCECCGAAAHVDKKFARDHDHQTGVFRGWLCWPCNSAIGKLGDNIEGLERAIAYLKRAQQ